MADLKEDEKKLLKTIFFYHDLGKSKVWDDEENKKATENKFKKGELHQSMIGHAEASIEEIVDKLNKIGVTSNDMELAVDVIKNHMAVSIEVQDPIKTVKQIDSIKTEDKGLFIKMLAKILEIDGNATEHVELKGGELVFSKNAKKLQIDVDKITSKYKQGKKMLIDAENKERMKKEADALEVQILGEKMSDFLAKKGKKGKEMGEYMKKIKEVIAQNAGKPHEEVKSEIEKIFS